MYQQEKPYEKPQIQQQGKGNNIKLNNIDNNNPPK